MEDRRKDMGTTGIKNSIAERFATLRNEHPHFTSERLLNILLSEGHWNGHRPSRSAFYRFVKIKGLGRKRKDATAIQEASAFAYEAFGQMWVRVAGQSGRFFARSQDTCR